MITNSMKFEILKNKDKDACSILDEIISDPDSYIDIWDELIETVVDLFYDSRSVKHDDRMIQ